MRYTSGVSPTSTSARLMEVSLPVHSLEPLSSSNVAPTLPVPPMHPLEPLTAGEVTLAVRTLQRHGYAGPDWRTISVQLKEPIKAQVHAWAAGAGATLPRQASAVCLSTGQQQTFTVEVDLTTGELLRARQAPADAQPMMSLDEQVECEQAVIHSSLMRDALKRHYGDIDPALLMVDIWSAGNYGADEDRTLRLARPLCFLRSDPSDNGYARPLEGIRPVVDLNRMEVIRVEEHGIWPLPPEPGNYSSARQSNPRSDIKPLAVTQPEGPGFDLQGHHLTWQKWSVVIGFNAREGLTLHHLRYRDGGRERPILFRASLTEMVVPYGDPSPTQARKNAFDVGEYGMGMCANSLRLGCDCLGEIAYLDGHLCDSRGGLLTIPNAICIHEEDFGVLWKHTDRRLPDAPEVRRSRRLVISSFSTVENYEYGFFWYLYQDGNIQFEIKLTGILSLGTVHEDEARPFGTMIAPLLYAPNHQHFFNMRLHWDIDGGNNTVQQVDVKADPVDESNPYRNAFRAVTTTLETEQRSCASLSLETGRTWKVVNRAVKNKTGAPVGYKFFPGDNAFPLASPDAWWRRRARFVDHHVWVTPFDLDQNFAAGEFPNQSTGTEGLHTFIAGDRPISDTDIVFWYTFGHTHLPRLEDYPVMPTAYLGFLLKPNGFFDQNPGNDVPPSPAQTKLHCEHC